MCINLAMCMTLDAVCDNMTCSGHGTCMNGECICDRLYSGEICQNKGIAYASNIPYFRKLLMNTCVYDCADECVDESDCNGHGSCVDVQSTSYPIKQCYCNSGWFGQNCARCKILLCTYANVLSSCFFLSM